MTRRRRAGLVAALAVAGLLAGCSTDDGVCPDTPSACASPPPPPSPPTGTEPSYSARGDFTSPGSPAFVTPAEPPPSLTPGPLVPEPVPTGGRLPIPVPSDPVD